MVKGGLVSEAEIAAEPDDDGFGWIGGGKGGHEVNFGQSWEIARVVEVVNGLWT